MLQLAATAGAEAEAAIRGSGETVDKARLQQRWSEWLGQVVPGQVHPAVYESLMRAFVGGAHAGNPEPPDWLLLPESRPASCILTAMNEERTIGSVLEQLVRMPLQEIIVVVNGSADRTRDIAETFEGVKVLHYEKALGHDVGRTLGAKEAQGDLLLFMDADFAVPGELLLPFFLEIRNGADIVLNDISPFVDRFDRRDEVTIMKEFLNRVLDRNDLSVNSLTAVPHVMTRQAAWRIGLEKLAVPPLAQVLALEAGLRVGKGGHVNVVKQNRLRTSNTGAKNPVAEMIIGDHMEALSQLIKLKGPRLAYADTVRQRRR
ncbi:hypothetical protein XYCOK13_13320 [Xylanibacillus composti]|uniref:Glycosyltransferase 2-like domain-containing protein n=1 Tax=Xylanibacillus composti TaxID=1572762 RepID=A0A8J4H4Q9_9BACL|nr:hypothetical protein XYCOK13_13320 [Xylanibacillus composti]